ncbi:lysoplasmalogenase [Tamlana sp. 62-3]|uniref:Lysoplasmalogenase n=1 Tax=Neotamlana sargassicola TaxID=2883125 RepID=A0A9X1I6L8_9FLAO|nr:lysoplasmalogenase family protein [Tamlana sargassicola]MCB4808800.1 lysoplasmalogenase [Tamlana sargassicola]
MNKIFKSKLHFGVVYFTILLIDVIVKNISEVFLFRIVTKSSLLLALFILVLNHNSEQKKRNMFYLKSALMFFWVGDMLMLFDDNMAVYFLAIFFFLIGKLFYVLRLSTKKDFSMNRLVPYVFFGVAFIFMVYYLIYNGLCKSCFFLILLYFFAALLVFLFALIRKNAVTRISYRLVLLGVVFSFFSDTITALSSFSEVSVPFSESLIMVFYGLFQFFIVVGILEDKNVCIFNKNCKSWSKI